MKGIQNKKGVDLQKPVPSCMGRVVNLFDLSDNLTGPKLLTEKPHRDGYPPRRSFSDDFSIFIDQALVHRGEKQRQGKQGGTPIKMLIEEEMWREETETNQKPPSVVARLMGLNEFPESIPTSEDIAPRKTENSRKHDSSYEKKMALVRQKFAEAKHMATNEKLFHSKEFQDALQFLSSNRDLFIKFLEEPSSLFASNNAPPSPEIKQITVLKPSSELIKKMPKEHCSLENRDIDISLTKPPQPTRIVVLKPSLDNIHDTGRSIFEDGYTGGDISFSKCDSINLDDDAEVYTPSSGRSWDYNNSRMGSPISLSSYKEVNQSNEPRVIREAKKRLVERWEMVSSKVEEKSSATGTVSTLGEMLTIHEPKREEEHRVAEKRENENHASLHRSKSLPACTSLYEDGTEAGTRSGVVPKELEKSKSGKFRWKLPSLFFSKSSKRPVNYSSCVNQHNAGIDGEAIENEGGSCSSSCHDSQENCDISTKEVSSLDKVGTGTTDQQPSPISVLETSFASDFAGLANLSDISASLPPQALSRSPPIGSISRSLSWDNSQFEIASPNSLRLSRFFSRADEEQYNFGYIKKLIEFSKLEEGKPWYSPEMPLDPSLFYEISGCKFDGSKWKDRLLFDSVNEALVEIGNSTELGLYPWSRASHLDTKEPKIELESFLPNEIWSVVRRWCMTFESPGGYNCGNLEVDLVAKKEVTGAKFEKKLLFELFDWNKEICRSIIGEVIEELISEVFF
ncbi:hypothetical protein LUZ62_034358 [Rhynchospora pubera]|uniref:Uncharacterized protein n=1 Tax=Rhynchospora pubera TaxID=906938 RepID=A0AAV8EPF5_9POAL|nr:hypothetical protein LUZ62_034358 [Rhynchospora pubera]